MKRNIKAILSVAAAAMMVLSMAGCGSSASGSSSSAASTSGSCISFRFRNRADGEQIKVGMLQISEHVALDSCRQGFFRLPCGTRI